MKLSEQMRGTAARKIRPPAIWSCLREYSNGVEQLEAEMRLRDKRCQLLEGTRNRLEESLEQEIRSHKACLGAWERAERELEKKRLEIERLREFAHTAIFIKKHLPIAYEKNLPSEVKTMLVQSHELLHRIAALEDE